MTSTDGSLGGAGSQGLRAHGVQPCARGHELGPQHAASAGLQRARRNRAPCKCRRHACFWALVIVAAIFEEIHDGHQIRGTEAENMAHWLRGQQSARPRTPLNGVEPALYLPGFVVWMYVARQGATTDGHAAVVLAALRRVRCQYESLHACVPFCGSGSTLGRVCCVGYRAVVPLDANGGL